MFKFGIKTNFSKLSKSGVYLPNVFFKRFLNKIECHQDKQTKKAKNTVAQFFQYKRER